MNNMKRWNVIELTGSNVDLVIELY
jgi:hypothetical protein